MAMTATMSLLGAMQFDNSLMDGFSVPKQINKSNLIDNLLMETSEMEIMYSDIPFLKYAISTWSTKRLPVWQAQADIMDIEYNPLFSSYRTEHRNNKTNRNLNVEDKNNGSNNLIRDMLLNVEENRETTLNEDETLDVNTEQTENRDSDTSSNTDSTTKTNLEETVSLIGHVTNDTKNESLSETKGHDTSKENITENVTNGGQDATNVYNTSYDSITAQLDNNTQQTFGKTTDTNSEKEYEITRDDTTNVDASSNSSTDTNNTTTTTGEENVTSNTTNDTNISENVDINIDTKNDRNRNVDTNDNLKSNTIDKGSVDVNTSNTENKNENEELQNDMWFTLEGSGENNSAQQLLTQEREFRMFSVVDFIIKDFISKFCILIY